MIRRAYRFLASFQFATDLMLVGLLYYLLLAIWGARVPKAVVANIADLVVFKVLYALFFLNLILCTESRLRALLSRFSFPRLGSVLFHLGLFLFPGAWYLSQATRFEGQAMVTEGFSFWGEAGDYQSREPAQAPEQRLPLESFRLEKITPEFWEDKFLFTKLEGKIAYPALLPEARAVVSLSHPLRLGFTRINLVGFGWAPSYTYSSPLLSHPEQGVVNLNLFPPGSEDSFLLPNSPFRVYLSLMPDAVPREGGFGYRSLNLRDPRFHLRVYSLKEKVFEGWVKPGEPVELPQAALAFGDVRYFGLFRVVRDPGQIVWYSGLFLVCLGAALRYLP